MAPSADFWSGKRVLLTGHSGFKGGWLALWLARLGAQVTGLSLPPATSPNLFEAAGIAENLGSHFGDIRDAGLVADLVRTSRPQIVLHLAAQPLVRASYRAPLDTFASNVMGTAHLLDALRGQQDVRVAVIVTTDKVYQNHEWLWPYRETDALGGHDPYSASKAAAEIVTASYRKSFLDAQGTAVATARAGNVIGGGDWSEDRLIPDAIRAWSAGRPLSIRHPDSIRPWQHVLEPLAGYLLLAEKLWEAPALADAFNFGPPPADTATVRDVIDLARAVYGKGETQYGREENTQLHEAGYLSLENSKAHRLLGIQPRWSLPEAVRRTIDWYRRLAEGQDARHLCASDLDAYTQDAKRTQDV